MRLIAPDVFFNLGIALAYFAIPFGLYRLLLSSAEYLLPLRSVLWMFFAFILACGTSHVTGVMATLYGGWFYPIDIAISGLTFVISATTALLLFRNGKAILNLFRHLMEIGA